MSLAAAYTSISNIKAYSDGANGLGTGVEAYAKAVTTYATPAEATAIAGYTDLFSYTSGSPLTLGCRAIHIDRRERRSSCDDHADRQYVFGRGYAIGDAHDWMG